MMILIVDSEVCDTLQHRFPTRNPSAVTQVPLSRITRMYSKITCNCLTTVLKEQIDQNGSPVGC